MVKLQVIKHIHEPTNWLNSMVTEVMEHFAFVLIHAISTKLSNENITPSKT